MIYLLLNASDSTFILYDSLLIEHILLTNCEIEKKTSCKNPVFHWGWGGPHLSAAVQDHLIQADDTSIIHWWASHRPVCQQEDDICEQLFKENAKVK